MGTMIEAGGLKYTYGSSKAAISLMNILERDEFKDIRDKVFSKLSKQDFRLNTVMDIKNKGIREASLFMWHKQFADVVKCFPEIVRTHAMNVETSIFRRLMRESRGKIMLTEHGIFPITESHGVIWHEGETNESLAERDYGIRCGSSIAPIIIFKGYHIWWCESHHQPLPWCELARLDMLTNK
jgi:hypothetical protein